MASRCDEIARHLVFCFVVYMSLSVSGPNVLIKHEKEIACLARLGYLYVTTALGKLCTELLTIKFILFVQHTILFLGFCSANYW